MSGKLTVYHIPNQCDWMIGVFIRSDWFRIKPFEYHRTLTKQCDWMIGVFIRSDWFRIKPFEYHRILTDSHSC